MPFFRRIFSSKILPSWTIFLLDAIIVAVSVVFAYFVRFPISEVVKMGGTPWLAVLLVTVVNLLFFRLFRTYSNILRLSSFVDVMHIFVATTLAFLCCVILTLLWKPIFGTRLTYIAVLIIAYVVAFMVLATSRMVIKMLYDYFKQNKQSMQNTYIYGTRRTTVSGSWASSATTRT